METKKIKILLESYYNGETTEHEEQILKQYFLGNSVDPSLLEEKEFFIQLNSDNEIEIPIGLETKLDSLITNLEKKESKKPISIGSKSKEQRLWLTITSIAACVAIIFAAGFYIGQGKVTTDGGLANTELKDTYSDPQQAYQEAEKALMIVSTNFNKGIKELHSVSASIDQSNEVLNTSLNKIK